MKNRQKLSLFLLTLLFVLPAHAAVADIQDILANLRSIVGPLTVLVLTISFVAGIGMIWRGLGMLRRFGMPLTQMSQQGEIAGPIVYLVVGAILVYIPTATDIMTRTIFGENLSFFDGGSINYANLGALSDEFFAYAAPNLQDEWSDLADTIILFTQFIGFLAFLRGWFIVARAGQPGVQPGSISKGITHIVGGIILVNIVAFLNVLTNTIFTS